MTPKSKCCTKCGVEKPLDEFYKHKTGKFGRQSRCKVCIAEYKEANRGRIAEYQRRYRENHREEILERSRQNYGANPEKMREKQRRYREKNLEKCLDRCRRYKKANRAKISEQERQYREANREKRQEWKRRWGKENPEKCAATRAKRRAAKLNRTPSWADLETIKLFYEARQAISEATGKEYHVDHMIPLQGKTVSGLHVPGNLQIIPAERNIAKSNTF